MLASGAAGYCFGTTKVGDVNKSVVEGRVDVGYTPALWGFLFRHSLVPDGFRNGTFDPLYLTYLRASVPEDEDLDSAAYTIRRASITDLYDVCMIEENSFDDPYPRVLLAELLRRCPASFVAVDVDGRVIGYCVSSMRAEEAHLISIAVLGSRRRIGIAKTLINELKRFLSDRGVMTLFLEVRVDNGTAIRLYSRLGFRRVRIIDRYYSNGASALKMQIGLNMSSSN